MLKLDLDKVVKAVLNKKAKIVAVQIPEGLKQHALDIVEAIETKANARVFLLIDPCYGACDLADGEAKRLGAELLLHFGHSPFLKKTEVETVYIPLKYELKKGSLAILAEKISKNLEKGTSIGVCTTVQYLGFLEEFKKLLEKKGLKVFVGQGKGTEKGQILGCNYSSVKSIEAAVDSIVFLGDGLFHPLGISFCCNKPVFTANPLGGEVREIKGERDLFLRKRFAAIALAQQAERFGILVSTKKGQSRKGLAIELKKKIEAKGKKAFLLAGNLIKSDYLLGMKLDALVSTACPRIAFDDASSFKHPVVSPSELLIVFGEKKIDDYNVDKFS